MTVAEALANAKYVVNANGEKTDVLLPMSAWATLLEAWKQMTEHLEDEEDVAILREWLDAEARGEAETMSLDDFVEELKADGLLSDEDQ